MTDDRPEDETLRWGIVGCGDVCERKSGPALQRAPGSTVVKVMRRDGDKARDYAERHGIPGWTDDAEALVSDPAVDAVYVATPPDTHEEMARLAAEAGKPVLVEKPLAHTLASAEALFAACRNVPLFCAYYRRHMPRFARIAVALKGIGPLTRIRIVERKRASMDREGWRHRPGAGEGGLFVDTGSHMINIVEHLVGEVDLSTIRAEVSARPGAVPHRVAADLTAGGVPVEGLWDYEAEAPEDLIAFEGTRGRLQTACFSPSPIRLTGPDGTREIDGAYPEFVHQPMVEAILRDLAGGDPCAVRGAPGLQTSRVLDRILSVPG